MCYKQKCKVVSLNLAHPVCQTMSRAGLLSGGYISLHASRRVWGGEGSWRVADAVDDSDRRLVAVHSTSGVNPVITVRLVSLQEQISGSSRWTWPEFTSQTQPNT